MCYILIGSPVIYTAIATMPSAHALQQSAVHPYTFFFSLYGSFFVYRIIISLLFFLFLFRHYAHIITTIIIIARKLKATEAQVAAYRRHTHTRPADRARDRSPRQAIRPRKPVWCSRARARLYCMRVCAYNLVDARQKRPKSLNQSSKTTIIIFNIVRVCVHNIK